MHEADESIVRVAGILLYREGGVLLQHRDNRPDIASPGLYSFFGGHLDAGEGAEEGARREVQEELDLALVGPLPRVYYEETLRREFTIFAADLLVDPADLTLREGQGMKMFTALELISPPVVERHAEIARQFFASPQTERILLARGTVPRRLTIRPARTDDMASISRLTLDTNFPGLASSCLFHPIVDPDLDIEVVDDAGEVAGFATLRSSGGDRCQVTALYLHPRARGVGIGSRLLERLLAQARRRAFRSMALAPQLASTPAASFFERHTFEL